MAWTAADVETLKKAIASGVKEATFGTETIKYQDTASMLKLLSRMEAEIAAASASSSTSRTILIQHGRGV
ncbi:MAG: hypothetical protein ABFD96_25485 [Armatimonadia bacterium]